jgi:hypothetical protein
MKTELKERFHAELESTIMELKNLKLNCSGLEKMLAARGGYETAKILIGSKEQSSGFTDLLLLGKKQISVEAKVIDERFRELFSDEEIKICKDRMGI